MSETPDAAKRVLVTGAAGTIGRALRDELHQRYRLRLMYHRTVLPQQGRDEVIVADITDLAQMEAACEGMDAVVHLAADPGTGAPWSSILPKNIVGTYNIYEAAHRCGVECVVFASTNHVMGMYEKDGVPQRPELLPVRPDGYYGASKAFGEALGRYYADAFRVARNLSTHWLVRAATHGAAHPSDLVKLARYGPAHLAVHRIEHPLWGV